MKTRCLKRHVIGIFVCLMIIVLATTTVSGTALALSASDATESVEAVDGGYDFSAPGSQYTVNISPSEMLLLLGAAPSEEESDYVDRTSTLSLSYDAGITTDNIKIFLTDQSEELSVLARPYTYETESAITVTWVPTSVSFNGTSAEFSVYDAAQTEYPEFIYLATLTDVLADEEASPSVEVCYETHLTVSREAANLLINLAYTDALAAKNRIESENAEYERLSAEHKTQSALFAEYLIAKAEFDAKQAVYDAYLSELAEYNAAVYARDEYERALDDYERMTEEYRIFKEVTEPQYKADYARYLVYKDAYDYYSTVELPVYEASEANAAKFREHLKIIETVKTPMTDGRTLYDAIMGSTVTQVLARQDEIVAAGIPEHLVTLAGDATEKLRELFTGYFSLSTEADKYFYYQSNYISFRDNFYDLLRALDYFYTFDNDNGLVRTHLVSEEKAKKYVILLAQLYIVTSALNDGRIYAYSSSGGAGREFTDSMTWSYSLSARQEAYGNATVVTPLAMLENVVYLTDTNAAAPYDEQFPELVEKPVAPEAVPMPEPLVTVYPPVEPDFVPEAGEPPEYVDEPQPIPAVDDPGEEPVPYTPTKDETALVALLEGGELEARTELTEDVVLTRTVLVNKKVFSSDETTVYFYASADADVPLYVTTVDSGTAANFRGTLPKKPTDARYHYKFSHWTDENGNAVDLSSVEGSYLYLFSAFSTTDVLYTVTWNVDGVITKTKHKYGDVPSFGGTPERAKDDTYVYVFSGWDQTVVPVKGIKTYTAIFDKKEYYTVEWRINGETYFSECIAGEIPECPVDIPENFTDSTCSYIFSAWDNELLPADSDAVYTAVFSKEYILPAGSGGASFVVEGTSVTVDTTAAGSSGVSLLPILDRLDGRSLSLVTEGGSLSIKADVLKSMLAAGVTHVSLAKQSDAFGSGYSIVLLDASGAPVSPSAPYLCDVILPLPDGYTSAMSLYIEDGEGNRSVVPAVIREDGTLLAKRLESGTEYFLAELYSVEALVGEGLTVTAAATLVRAGERVEILAAAEDGLAINKLYYIDSVGAETAIFDGAFTMPASDVTVWGSTVPQTFKIRFVNYDGRSVERTCGWGEMPTPPVFIRTADSTHSYTFSGWDSELLPAFSDATYTAVYESALLPVKNDGRVFETGFDKFKYYVTLYAINIYRYRVPVIISAVVSAASCAGLVIFKKYRKKHPIS